MTGYNPNCKMSIGNFWAFRSSISMYSRSLVRELYTPCLYGLYLEIKVNRLS